MWEEAIFLRDKLVSVGVLFFSLFQYYGTKGPLSLLCLNFINHCCHYFTSRDDSNLYTGRTRISNQSIQFTIDAIPMTTQLINRNQLVNDGYVGND